MGKQKMTQKSEPLIEKDTLVQSWLYNTLPLISLTHVNFYFVLREFSKPSSIQSLLFAVIKDFIA